MDVKVQARKACEVICERSTQSYTASQLTVLCSICALSLRLSFGSNVSYFLFYNLSSKMEVCLMGMFTLYKCNVF